MDLTNFDLNWRDFLPINGSTQINSFLGATENTFLSIKTLSNYITDNYGSVLIIIKIFDCKILLIRSDDALL